MTFTVVGRLGPSLLLSYRTPAASVKHLLPPGLELVTRDHWAFWNVVACRIERARPRGVPAVAGVSYHHIAYRLHVQARTARDQVIEGLFFVRSDVDNPLVAAAGDLVTDFCLHRATVNLNVRGGEAVLAVQDTQNGRGEALLRADTDVDFALAPNSCFASVEEAARFLRHRPRSLGCDGRRLKLAEGLGNETAWREKPMRVREARWGFLEYLDQHDTYLERATLVAPLAYRWRLGRRLLLKES